MLGISFVLAAVIDRPACIASEKRDAATIRRLEGAWNDAFLNGDTAFEKCLLLPDFQQINHDGSVTDLTEELARAERNRAKPMRASSMPPVQVIIHGDTAVAYGVVIKSTGKRSVWADYYIWNGSSWHAYFAQQTRE